jgi:hypothetical protein
MFNGTYLLENEPIRAVFAARHPLNYKWCLFGYYFVHIKKDTTDPAVTKYAGLPKEAGICYSENSN